MNVQSQYCQIGNNNTIQIFSNGSPQHQRKQRHTKRKTKILKQPPRNQRSKFFDSKLHNDIVVKLFDLQFSGKWNEMDQTCSLIAPQLKDSPSTDLNLIMLAQHCVSACHNGKPGKAKRIVMKANKMLDGATNIDLLRGRLLTFKGLAYTKEKRLGKAQSCFEDAIQIFNVSDSYPHFHGSCLYHMTCIEYDVLCRQSSPEQKVFKKIMSDMKQAMHLVSNDNPVITKYLRARMMIKMATMYMDCDSHAGRTRDLTVNGNRMNKATKLLKSLETEPDYIYACDLGYLKCCYLQAKASWFFRKKEYVDAEEKAVDANELATLKGFKTQIGPSQQLIDDICRNKPYCVKSKVTEEEDISAGCLADQSNNESPKSDSLSDE